MKVAFSLFAIPILLWPVHAVGQSAPTPPVEAGEAPPLDRAKDDFRRGLVFLEEGRIEEAHASFEASFTRFPSKQNAINSALTLDRLGREVEALERYDLVLERFVTELSSDDKATIQATVETLSKKVATLVLRTPGSPVDVTIDGARHVTVSNTARVRLAPGRHDLSASAAHFASWRQSLLLPAGTQAEVTVSLVPVGAAGLPNDRPARVEPDARGTTVRWPGYLGVGVGVAATGLGAYLGARALADYGDATTACPAKVDCDPVATEQARDARSLGWVSSGFVIGGLAAVAIGGYLLIRPIRVAPHGTGIVALGTF